MSRVYRVFSNDGPMRRLSASYDYSSNSFIARFSPPKEASPIYTSIATSRSYSGSRTKLTTYPDTGARPITLTDTITESFFGSIPEWTWNRVYPPAYTNIGSFGFPVFEPDPTGPADPHESYFDLAPSLHVRPPYADSGGGVFDYFDPYSIITDYFDPKKQALSYAAGSAASPAREEIVVIGTRTSVSTGLDAGGLPTSGSLTVDITAYKYPGYNLLGTNDYLPRFLTATQSDSSWSPRLPVLTWGFLKDGVRYGVDVTAWSATKWRDYRGSYSAVIPMPRFDPTVWDSSNAETTVNWTLG